jgi:transcriptional regulator with XRE-family HTH domain
MRRLSIYMGQSAMNEIRIGMRVKLARTMLHLTQAQLAARVEVAQAYLSQIETGDRNPSDDLVDAIGHAMGCDIRADDFDEVTK